MGNLIEKAKNYIEGKMWIFMTGSLSTDTLIRGQRFCRFERDIFQKLKRLYEECEITYAVYYPLVHKKSSIGGDNILFPRLCLATLERITSCCALFLLCTMATLEMGDV
jgi:hypothetical protein